VQPAQPSQPVQEDRPIRAAASAICVRPGGAGPEVLVVRRSDESRFLPGYVAFPGGAVDPEDGAHATRWFGDAGEAPRAAGIRELVEEVGLALTAAGLIAVGRGDPFAAVDALPPRPDQLSQMTRWIAPPEVPVRFDARYYSVTAPVGLDPTPDGIEASESWWSDPNRLLEEWEAGERKLYWPTWLTVTHLAACATVDEVRALRFEPREPTSEEEATMPRSVMEQD
jgi:8-oxo-dGTP pyrophosphatase MutT (NUDIX family)